MDTGARMMFIGKGTDIQFETCMYVYTLHTHSFELDVGTLPAI